MGAGYRIFYRRNEFSLVFCNCLRNMLGERGLRAFSTVMCRICAWKIVPFDWDLDTLTLKVGDSKACCVSFFIAATHWLRCVHLATFS